MNTSATSSVTRTWRFHRTGGPEVLRLESLPTPEPGYGQVRLRVQSLSLNRADLLWLANICSETPKLPARLGYEVAGVVEAVGPGVTTYQTGDRVSSIPALPSPTAWVNTHEGVQTYHRHHPGRSRLSHLEDMLTAYWQPG
jgi:NADPH:quinone reductase-like Zn-dependent oxidoreductase